MVVLCCLASGTSYRQKGIRIDILDAPYDTIVYLVNTGMLVALLGKA